MSGLRDSMAVDLATILSNTAELGEAATVVSTTVNVIGIQSFQDALAGGTAIEGRITAFYCLATALDVASGNQGDAVTFRGVSYTIGRIERSDSGLARVELVR
jgi:hypothetical protein